MRRFRLVSAKPLGISIKRSFIIPPAANPIIAPPPDPGDNIALQIYNKLTAWWEMTESGLFTDREDYKGGSDAIVIGGSSGGHDYGVGNIDGIRDGELAAISTTLSEVGTGQLIATYEDICSSPDGAPFCFFGWFYGKTANKFYESINRNGDFSAIDYDIHITWYGAPNNYYDLEALSLKDSGSGYNGNYITQSHVDFADHPFYNKWTFFSIGRTAENFLEVRIKNDLIDVAYLSDDPYPIDDTTGESLYFSQSCGMQRHGFIKDEYLTAEEFAYLYNEGQSVTWAELIEAGGI